MNNMRKHAVVANNTVTEIVTINDSEYIELARKSQLVVDIHDLLISPQVGWRLNGNRLEPAPGQAIDLKEMIKARISYYQQQAPSVLQELYAQNTMLGITTAQSDEMFEDFQDVLIRLREGAWPTAIYRLSQKQPSGFVTQDMINIWTALIQAKMV